MRTATITPLPQPSAADAAPLRDDDVDAASPQDARLARARTALNTLAARSRKSATTGKDSLVAALTALVTLDGKLRRRRRRSWAGEDGAGPSSRSGSVSFAEAGPEVREYELTPRELWEKLVRWEELRAYANSTEGRSAIKSVHVLCSARGSMMRAGSARAVCYECSDGFASAVEGLRPQNEAEPQPRIYRLKSRRRRPPRVSRTTEEDLEWLRCKPCKLQPADE